MSKPVGSDRFGEAEAERLGQRRADAVEHRRRATGMYPAGPHLRCDARTRLHEPGVRMPFRSFEQARERRVNVRIPVECHAASTTPARMSAARSHCSRETSSA